MIKKILLTKDLMKTLDIESSFIDLSGIQFPTQILSLGVNSFTLEVMMHNINISSQEVCLTLVKSHGSITLQGTIVSSKFVNGLYHLDINIQTVLPQIFQQVVMELSTLTAFSSKRKEERIILNKDSIQNLCLLNDLTTMYFSLNTKTESSECLIKNISYSGIVILTHKKNALLLKQECAVKIDFINPVETFITMGNVMRTKIDQNDICEIAILLKNTPVCWKLRLKTYFDKQF